MAAAASCRRVLVVEDDPSSRDALCDLLRRSGWNVSHCANVGEGVAEIRRVRPDCILLDLMLPGLSGDELLRVIRQNDWPVRVAVVTAARDPKQFQGVREHEPDAIFRKPLDLPALLEWLGGDSPRR